MTQATIIEALPEDEQLSLLRLATLLTGDERSGVETLARSAVRVSDHEEAIDAQDYALETARRQLVRTFVAARDGQQRDQKIRHAAVALHYFGDLSLAETARAMDLPTERLTSELNAADSEADLYETWAPLSETSPDVAMLVPEIHRQRQHLRSKRRRTGVLITLAALIMAAGVIIPTVIIPRLPHTAHRAGEWTFVHKLELSGGWSIAARQIDNVSESTYATLPDGPHSTGPRCYLTLTAPGKASERFGFDPEAIKGDRFRVDNRLGKIVRPADYESQPVLIWQYGSDAWALANCSSQPEQLEATLKRFTAAIRYEAQPIRVPARLMNPPADFQVDHVLSMVDPVFTTNIFLSSKETHDWNVMVSTALGSNDPDGESVKVKGDRWLYAAKTQTLCSVATSKDSICLSAAWTNADRPAKERAAEARPLLISVAQSLQIAENVKDRNTWFDAQDAFP